MKKTARHFLLMSALFGGLLITSCSSDDNDIDIINPTDDAGTPNPGASDNVLNGSLDQDMTLDANTTYQLSGILSVESGVTLTIPAGTEIVADPDLDDSDATNVYIVVQKGGDIEINGTASAPVIMRSSNGQAGSWGGLIIAGNAETTEGSNATAEVGGILYGGSDAADDSGSINYLVLSDAGAQINSESQFNGLSLYAVGSGTSIMNVALLNGADDGVEFFGGSANAMNLYLENNEDDAVDWTEGWNGTLDNVYVLHTIENFSTAIEADGEDKQPTINNFTAVSTKGGTALQFKKNSGAIINGLSLNGYDNSVDIPDDTRTDLSNIQLNGENAEIDNAYSLTPTVMESTFDWISNRGQVSVLPNNIDSDLALNGDSEYVISDVVSVNAGATLTIPAGAKITARSDADTDATSIYIVVQQGAMIDVQGTESNPVMMSSTSGQPGSWGGLVIAGNAQTTEGLNATAEVGGIVYGGSNAEDNSGSISYLILKDAGAQINSESQYNGLSLYAVGSGTTIDNIAIINGADDGVEFFGGSVAVTNAYFENNEDDQIDWTEGWNGSVTNAYINLSIDNFSTVVEADGENNMPTLNQITAVSTAGGTALQFKKLSGATINGLSLSGFETNIDIADDTRTDLSGIKIDGEDADVDAAYDAEATVDATSFDWVN